MKVLFVSSGRKGRVSELILNQGNSISEAGVDVQYYVIKNGFPGYLISIIQIRKAFKKGKFDLIHAHYSLSAFSASLAGNMPIIVSLLGSDAYKSFLFRWLTRIFSYYRWNKTIVKTFRMQETLKLKESEIIPNGVNMDRFKPIRKPIAREKIKFPVEKKLVIFVSDPKRQEKNFKLAFDAVKYLNRDDIELMPVFNVPNVEIPFYINAADVLLLTSKREGSVNVVKEAMACNVPVVSTDVGDVKENTSGLTGYYICDSTPASLAGGLLKSFSHNGVTCGRERIFELELDSASVAGKIINIYEQILNK